VQIRPSRTCASSRQLWKKRFWPGLKMSCEMSGERKSTGKLFHTAAGALKPCIICFRYTVWRYLVLDHGRALRAKYLDRLENVDDALVSHPLQDDAQRDKHARPTDTGAASIPYTAASAPASSSSSSFWQQVMRTRPISYDQDQDQDNRL